MAELRTNRVEVYEVVEQGYGGQRVVHGTFTSREEAGARYQQVLARRPSLGVTMSLVVAGRYVETVEALEDEPEAPDAERRRGDEDTTREGAER